MRSSLYNGIGYYCWLVPSCISFTLCSFLILHNVLNKKRTVLRRLQNLYAVGEVLQCLAWFAGPIYTVEKHNNSLCPTQEILFECGLALKAATALVLSATLASYSLSRDQFNLNKLRTYFCLSMTWAITFLILGFIFQSRKAACEGLADHKYDQLRQYELAYLLFFYLPIITNTFLVAIFCSIGLYYRQEDLSSALLSPVYDTLVVFLVIVTAVLTPCIVFFAFVLLGRMNIVLYCLTGIIISSAGAAFSVYHFCLPYIFKLRRFNLFFFLERLENVTSFSPSHVSSRSTELRPTSIRSPLVSP